MAMLDACTSIHMYIYTCKVYMHRIVRVTDFFSHQRVQRLVRKHVGSSDSKSSDCQNLHMDACAVPANMQPMK